MLGVMAGLVIASRIYPTCNSFNAEAGKPDLSRTAGANFVAVGPRLRGDERVERSRPISLSVMSLSVMPASCRASTSLFLKGVDARDKAGHDD